MKIFLDDLREQPEGWILIKDPDKAINLMKLGLVKEISLDHDLGCEKTGYDVILWIERNVFLENFIPPLIYIHTANPVGYKKIMNALIAIKKEIERKRKR